MGCLGRFGSQVADVNIALTAINKISTVGDFAKHRAAEEALASTSAGGARSAASAGAGRALGDGEEGVDELDAASSIWISMVRELAALSRDPRPEVRNCALQTLFSSIMAHSNTVQAGDGSKLWERCVRAAFSAPSRTLRSAVLSSVLPLYISSLTSTFCRLFTFTQMPRLTMPPQLVDEVFPLVTAIAQALTMASSSGTSEVEAPELGRSRNGAAVLMVVHHSRNTAEKQWNETVVLALGCMTRVMRCAIASAPGVENELWFSEIWQKLLSTLGQLVLREASAASSEKMEVELAAITTLQEMMVIAVTRGSPPATEARYSTTMRVVDGALLDAAAAPAAALAPMDVVDEAPLAERDAWTGLWDSAWQLCEGVGKSAAVVLDDEERVATALAKALGAVYESGASVGGKACRTLRKGSQVIKVLALMQGILARLNGRVADCLAASGGVAECRSKPSMSRKFKRVTPFEQSYLGLMKSILPLEDDAWVQVMLQLSQHVADALLDRTCVAPSAPLAFSAELLCARALPRRTHTTYASPLSPYCPLRLSRCTRHCIETTPLFSTNETQ
jgi:hypothetical protein